MQKKFKIQNHDTIISNFNSLSEKPQTEFSIEELVNKFSDLISKALKLGYTHQEIATLVFTDCKISGRLLKKTYETLMQRTNSKLNKKVKINE